MIAEPATSSSGACQHAIATHKAARFTSAVAYTTVVATRPRLPTTHANWFAERTIIGNPIRAFPGPSYSMSARPPPDTPATQGHPIFIRRCLTREDISKADTLQVSDHRTTPCVLPSRFSQHSYKETYRVIECTAAEGAYSAGRASRNRVGRIRQTKVRDLLRR